MISTKQNRTQLVDSLPDLYTVLPDVAWEGMGIDRPIHAVVIAPHGIFTVWMPNSAEMEYAIDYAEVASKRTERCKLVWELLNQAAVLLEVDHFAWITRIDIRQMACLWIEHYKEFAAHECRQVC